MKRFILIPVILTLTILGYGQKSVDALFEKYAGSDGFTSITISGNLINLVRALDNDKSDDDRCWPVDITTVRILTQDDDDMFNGNFYDMVEKEIDSRNYEEFMRVKEYKQDLVMLVKADGRKIKEFLIVAGGRDNFLMQIKGNMTYEEARRFSKSIKNDNGVNIVISCK
jgi:hypothetical protein